MSEISFTKMQGLGNDFVLLNAIDEPVANLSSEEIIRLADRRLGVGADQILLLSKDADDVFKYQIWNADGNEVAQCGNGARSAYLFLTENNYASGKIKLKTSAGLIEVTEGSTGPRAFLGVPLFTPNEIPLNYDAQQESYEITWHDNKLQYNALSIGNPHAVFWDLDEIEYSLENFGRYFNQKRQFPQGVNVSFAKRISDNEINLRVYERGVGQTPACGSAAAAVSVFNFVNKKLAETKINLTGGSLLCGWDGNGSAWIEGAVATVYTGKIAL